jgi:phenylacetate-CoA ligase
MTLVEDKIIVELFSEYTTVTNLFNYTVPLIRYRLDDVLSKTALNRTDPYTHVEELVARTECNLLLDGDDGTPEYISAGQLLTMGIPGVKRFRCVVTNKRQITIHATFDGKLQREKALVANELLREFRQLLHNKGIFNIHPQIEEELEITTNPTTGKYKLVEYA